VPSIGNLNICRDEIIVCARDATPAAIMDAADKAMYARKRERRG
jgi:hypothetical protein